MLNGSRLHTAWRGAQGQSNSHGLHRSLKRPWAEEKLDDVALMRLQPVQFEGGEGADIQTVDVRCIDQLSLPLLILSNSAADQRRTNLLEHLFLGATDDAHEGEHELGIGKCEIGRVAVNHRRPQVATAFSFHQPRAESGGHIFDARLLEASFDGGPNRPGRTGHREGR